MPLTKDLLVFLSYTCAKDGDLEAVNPSPKPGNFKIAALGLCMIAFACNESWCL